MLPISIQGVKARHNGDGSFSLPRCHKNVQRKLDKEYVRRPNELTWMPRIKATLIPEDFREAFAGKRCYLVGKGPSLDSLKSFPTTDPVMCMNESIHQVAKLGLKNKLFAVQQDMGLRDVCYSEGSVLFVSRAASHWYTDHENVAIYHPEDYCCTSSSLSAVCAISIARSLGASDFVLCCFDACTDKNTAYAKCIGYAPTRGGSPSRFLEQKKYIELALKGIKFEYLESKHAALTKTPVTVSRGRTIS